MDQSNFLLYKKIKKQLNKFKVNLIQLDKLSSSLLAHFILLPNTPIVIKILKTLRSMFFVPRIDFNFINYKNIFIYSVDREDSKITIDFYKKKYKKKFMDFYMSNRKLKLYLSLKNYIYAYKITKKIKITKFTYKIYTFCSIVGGLNFYDYLYKNLNSKKIKIENFLTYNSSFMYEAILTVFLREKKIKTNSLQHAFYYKMKRISYDIINYENPQAENLLQWSNYCINSIKREVPKHTKQVNFGYIHTKNFKSSYSKKNKNIFVPLPRKIYFEDNIKLIKILEFTEFDQFNILISAHPNDKNKYSSDKKNIKFISEDFHQAIKKRKYQFIISFNTSCVFLSPLYNIPPLLFRTKNLEIIEKKFETFENKDELINIIKQNINYKYTSKLRSYFFK